jgi:general secretion pathway protein K
MARSKRIRAPKSSRGFIVVAVLWIIAALATLASIYALYVRETSAAFVGHDDRIEAQALARAGVELAVYQLTAIPERRPVQGQFRFRMGSAEVGVEYRSESGRIDLNLAPKEIFAGLFVGLGARREDAAEYADRIVAWRTPPTSGAADPAADAEGSLYSAAGKAYGPRRGPFQHTEELALVLGLPQILVDRALPHLTVYSGQAEINLLAATPEVLAALPGVTPDWLQVLLDQRQGAPQDVLRARLGPAARYVTAQPSKANRVMVEVRFDPKRRFHSDIVVLLLDGDSEPFRVLSWRDDSEGFWSDQRQNANLP